MWTHWTQSCPTLKAKWTTRVPADGGGRGVRAAPDAQRALRAGQAAKKGCSSFLSPSSLAATLVLDSRDHIYLSVIAVLMAVVLAQGYWMLSAL